MAVKKVGELIKEARTAAGLTQEALAKKIPGLSASDISKAERSEADLTQEQLKSIAKITGVTQKSLLEAAKGKSSSTGKTSSAKTSSGTKETLTATEKKVLELYRNADSKTKSLAKSILEGKADTTEILMQVLGNKFLDNASSSSSSSSSSDNVSDMISSLLGNVLGKK